MAARGIERRIHRNGVVEFDDPDTGRHVLMMDGFTVESGNNDALAVVSVASVITCGSCFRRWMTPIADYHHGWSSCTHCGANLFLPPVYSTGFNGQAGTKSLLPLCGHDFPAADDAKPVD